MSAPQSVIDDRYHVQRDLGKGAWGHLYAADDKPIYADLGGNPWDNATASAGASVVLELVRPSSVSQGVVIEREMRWFIRRGELHLLNCLECGRISSGRSAGMLYLAMETWKESLEDRIQSQAISDQELVLVSRAISLALAQMHDQGVHHAGVHPRRIVWAADKWKLVPSGSTVGIGPRISPPEKSCGPAGDVYAFGLTLLQGFLAARGHLVSLDRLASNHGQWLSHLTDPWRSSLRSCLQAEPKWRWTAQQFILAATPRPQPITEIRWEE